MKTYQEYYEEWQLSTESRDLAFDEWLMVQLARKEKQMIDKACEVYENELREIVRVVNGLRKGVGDCISIEGCIKDFRKAMEGQTLLS